MKETKKTILRLVASVLVIGILLVIVYGMMKRLGWTDLSQERLQELVKSAGAIAPLVYILISFIQVSFVPIPAAVTILAGSYVFGAARAFLYSYIGTLIGAMVAFGLGRWIGKRFVNWVSGGQEQTDAWIAKLKGKEKILLFFMFLFPFFPDDILCSVAGILPISWGGFFLMQVVTRATSVGATLLLMSGQIIPFHGWGLIVLGIILGVGLFAFLWCFRNAARINAFVASFCERMQALKKRGNQDRKK